MHEHFDIGGHLVSGGDDNRPDARVISQQFLLPFEEHHSEVRISFNCGTVETWVTEK